MALFGSTSNDHVLNKFVPRPALVLATLFLAFHLAWIGASQLIGPTGSIGPSAWLAPVHWGRTIFAILLLLAAVGAFVLPWAPRFALLPIGVMLTLHFSLLIANPFYNTVERVAPLVWMLFLCLGALGRTPVTRRLNGLDLLLLVARVFIGLILLTQGTKNIIRGPWVLAEKNYVTPVLQRFFPTGLLWAMGMLNPFWETLSGLWLLSGWRLQVGAWVASGFLATICLGHGLMDTSFPNMDVSNFCLNNLAFVLLVAVLTEPKRGETLDPDHHVINKD